MGNNFSKRSLLMFNKKQIIRNYVFAFFCALILLISVVLTYYISFYDEEKAVEEMKIENKESRAILHNEVDEKCPNGNSVTSVYVTYFINSFIFKLMGDFFAGGILSDGLFIKIGVF